MALAFPLLRHARLHGLKWQTKVKATPFARFAAALHPDISPHGFNKLLADRQPQTGATHRAIEVTLQAYEALEETLLVRNRNPQTIIADAHDGLLPKNLRAYLDRCAR